LSVPDCAAASCQVWWAAGQPASPDQIALLDEPERARRARFRRDEDRDRYTTATLVLRQVLGAQLGVPPEKVPLDRTCPNCGGHHGRPRLPDTPYALSIAHAGEWVAVACGRVDAVGVDVEAVARARPTASMTRLVLSPTEREAWETIPEVDREEAFLHYWTCKEAVLKATGDGLRVPMTRVSISPPGEAPSLHGFEGRDDLPATLRLTRLAAREGYAATVAVIAPATTTTVTVTEHDATALL
jgi:4'-phosphopantetheinyl transferase